ncbi:putative glucan endo-1,3-beta-glucosidase 5-like [Capsicum annuum]|nr:putative glucan endo-1,3-beta-glucosidase 5-like [Capsicum annuum]
MEAPLFHQVASLSWDFSPLGHPENGTYELRIWLNKVTVHTVVWVANRDTPLNDTSGNLVVRDAAKDKPESYLWRSFDDPGDTLLPGMKLGTDLKTGFRCPLWSWKSTNDPSRGRFTWTFDPRGFLQTFTMNGSIELYGTGSSNGRVFPNEPSRDTS